MNDVNENNKLIGWIFSTPTAIQVTAQLFEGFIVPGVLGIFFRYWQTITRSLWEKLFVYIPIDIESIRPVLDLLTLGLLVFATLIGVTLRRKDRHAYKLKSAFNSTDSQAKKRLIAFGTAAVVHVYIIIFSINTVLNQFTSSSGQMNLTGILLFYLLSFAFIYVAVEYYLTFPYDNITERIEQDRINRRISLSTFYLFPGLFFTASMLGFGLLFLAINMMPVTADMVRPLILKLYAFSFLLFWLTHFRFNIPRSASIVDNTKLLINGIMIVGLAMLPLSPFIWNSVAQNGQESGPLLGGALFLGAILTTVSFVYLMKSNWKVPVNILIIVGLIIFADKILTYIANMVPSTVT